jgi:hypothetical protein
VTIVRLETGAHGQIGLADRRANARLAPHLASQEPQRLLFPVWAHVDVTAACAAFRAHDLAGEPRHFNIVGEL